MTSQVILFSHPRTACHFLERTLSGQSNVKYLSHPFVPSWFLQLPMLQDVTTSQGIAEDQRLGYVQAVDEGLRAWQTLSSEAEREDQKLFLHEHPHFALDPDVGLRYIQENGNVEPQAINITLIPDEILLRPGTVPIFTTRHPGLIVPNALRMIKKAFPTSTRSNMLIASNIAWNRMLYDWYAAKGIQPIVVDTDDYLNHPELVRLLCEKAGLNPNEAVLSWNAATPAEIDAMHPAYTMLQQTLLHSTGVVPGKTSADLDLVKEEEKLRAVFDPADVAFVMQLVEKAMPHYQYLHDRRLRLPRKV